MMAADERSTFGNNVFPKFFELTHSTQLKKKKPHINVSIQFAARDK